MSSPEVMFSPHNYSLLAHRISTDPRLVTFMFDTQFSIIPNPNAEQEEYDLGNALMTNYGADKSTIIAAGRILRLELHHNLDILHFGVRPQSVKITSDKPAIRP